MDLGFGGAESNVAIGLARLGASVDLDGPARRRRARPPHRAAAARRGRRRLVDRDPDAPRPSCSRSAPPRPRAPSGTTGRSAGSRLAPAHLDARAHPRRPRPARHRHHGRARRRPRAALDAAIDAARDGGTIVSFDVNHRSRLWGADGGRARVPRDRRARRPRLRRRRRGRLLTGDREPPAQARRSPRSGRRRSVVKLGADGAVALVDGEWAEQSAFPVHVVDTRRRRRRVRRRLPRRAARRRPARRAAPHRRRVRRVACTAPGDWEAAPDRAAIARLLGSRRPRPTLTLRRPGADATAHPSTPGRQRVLRRTEEGTADGVVTSLGRRPLRGRRALRGWAGCRQGRVKGERGWSAERG